MPKDSYKSPSLNVVCFGYFDIVNDVGLWLLRHDLWVLVGDLLIWCDCLFYCKV